MPQRFPDSKPIVGPGAAALLALALVVPSRGEAQAKPPTQRRVLVMDIQHGGDVDADLAKTLTELVTARISSTGAFYVISGSELTQVATLESEKMRSGCTENSCLTELADALGARYVVFGRASTLGELRVVQLRMFDAGEARFLERATVQQAAIEDLTRDLGPATDKLIAPLLDPSERRALLQQRQDGPDEEPADADGGGNPLMLIAGIGGVGAGLLAAGGTLAGALYYNDIVADPTSSGPAKAEARSTGAAVAIGGGIASAALIGAGAMLVLFGAGK